MFTDRLALQIAAVVAAGISKTGMLAIVEVETGGQPLEADGHTPNFLFERHIFHRELSARQPGKVREAERPGLAIPSWNPPSKQKGTKGQHFDERTSWTTSARKSVSPRPPVEDLPPKDEKPAMTTDERSKIVKELIAKRLVLKLPALNPRSLGNRRPVGASRRRGLQMVSKTAMGRSAQMSTPNQRRPPARWR